MKIAPELNNDVYTIGVHQFNMSEAAGWLGKVFELAGAEATDFVRKTGDTMTGALEIKDEVTHQMAAMCCFPSAAVLVARLKR